MINISNLDTAIALGGYGAGLVIGCLNNVRKTGSLYQRPHDAPTNVSFVAKHLEIDRDRKGHRLLTSAWDLIKPKVWHPLMPLEHLAPLTLLVITQIFIASQAPGVTGVSLAILSATYTFKAIVLPLALNAAIFFGSEWLRYRFTPYASSIGIDTSGHALAQSASAIYKFFVFSALSSLNISSTPYRVIAAITALSDYLWTHRTASSYHSVMDMVFATLFMGFSFGTIFTGQRAIVAYAPGALRLIATKIPLKCLM